MKSPSKILFLIAIILFVVAGLGLNFVPNPMAWGLAALAGGLLL